MTHKFAGYLEDTIQRRFPTLDVDCEYNRNGRLPKTLLAAAKNMARLDNDRGSTVFPDIIVHRRRTDENVIVIEAKKSGGNTDFDRLKLTAFLDEYAYKYAMLIVFVTNGAPDIIIEPMRNGSTVTISVQTIMDTH